MIKGQCLCGAVQYQYHAEIENSILCYCSHCQQAQGSIAGWTAHLTKHNLKFYQDAISSKNTSTHRIKHVYFVKIVLAHFIHIVQTYPILFVCV